MSCSWRWLIDYLTFTAPAHADEKAAGKTHQQLRLSAPPFPPPRTSLRWNRISDSLVPFSHVSGEVPDPEHLLGVDELLVSAAEGNPGRHPVQLLLRRPHRRATATVEDAVAFLACRIESEQTAERDGTS